jgi:ribosomal protein S18 acetylase RimI-like enzyme
MRYLVASPGSEAFIAENSDKTKPPSVEAISEVLSESGISVESFMQHPSSMIVQCEDKFALAWIRDVCGKRMAVLGSFPSNYWKRSEVLKLFASQASFENCNLIQYLEKVNPENASFNVPNRFYISNFIYEQELSGILLKPSSVQVAFLVNGIDQLLNTGPTLEYFTRWQRPGSTYFRSDTLKTLEGEYKDLSELSESGIVRAVTVAQDPTSAFVLWIESEDESSATIAFIWVDEAMRGRGVGANLLNAALNHLAQRKFQKIDYFVSVQNYAALKMLRQTGFSLRWLVLNSLV